MSKNFYHRSFRLVCAPEQIKNVEAFLRAENYEFKPEPFSFFCRELIAEPQPLGSSLAAFFGYIYIQDRSAMLPPLALAPEPGGAVLDMCASPGGKTGFLAQLLGPKGFVLANEPNRRRYNTLRATLRDANLLNAGVCSYPGAKLPLKAASWSHILLDPPCSGWGAANKHPAAVKIWRGEKIKKLAAIQRELLRHAANLMRPGGRLLYSTCTTNWDENEAQTIYAEEELGLLREALEPFNGFVFEERKGGKGCLLVDKTKSAGQGFYLALLRKPEVELMSDAPPESQRNYSLIDRTAISSPVCDAGLLPPGEIGLFGGNVFLLPALSANYLSSHMRWQGAFLGSFHNGFMPEPRLRCLIPCEKNEASITFENIAEIRALLNGQNMDCGIKDKYAAIFWRDLPLGIASVKNGRLIARFN